jgi:hypothetical protein
VADRRELVQALVRYELPIEPVLEELASIEWDSEPLVVLHARDVLAILDRFLTMELTADQVTDWADRLEVRDDVELEPSYSAQIREWIFQLANPNLRRDVSTQVVQELRTEILHALGAIEPS